MTSQPRSQLFACPHSEQETTMDCRRVAGLSRILFVFLLVPSLALAQRQVVRQIPLTRSGPLPTTPPTGPNAQVGPELDSSVIGNDADGGDSDGGTGIKLNRTIAKGPGAPLSHR